MALGKVRHAERITERILFSQLIGLPNVKRFFLQNTVPFDSWDLVSINTEQKGALYKAA